MENQIKELLDNKSLLAKKENQELLLSILESLMSGELRMATREKYGWNTHGWLLDAIILSFQTKVMFPTFNRPDMQILASEKKVRTIGNPVVRYGAYIGSSVVLMPSLVNIGAYVGDRTMIDTWATIGAGAQIGAHCHISGGVGIGGMLEPRQDKPVIIEDGCFIGSRSVVVEGVIVGEGSILGANSLLTASTKIFDSRNGKATEREKGIIPPNVVVIPANYQAESGLFRPCMEIIKDVDSTVRKKMKINEQLRN